MEVQDDRIAAENKNSSVTNLARRQELSQTARPERTSRDMKRDAPRNTILPRDKGLPRDERYIREWDREKLTNDNWNFQRQTDHRDRQFRSMKIPTNSDDGWSTVEEGEIKSDDSSENKKSEE